MTQYVLAPVGTTGANRGAELCGGHIGVIVASSGQARGNKLLFKKTFATFSPERLAARS